MQPLQGSLNQRPQLNTNPTEQAENDMRFLPRSTNASFRIRGAQSTSAALRTVTCSIDHFKEIPKVINLFKNEYHGGKHAVWAKTLFRELGSRNKISIEQIQEHASKLIEHVGTIKHWKIENVIQVFTYLSRVGFFSQINRLAQSADHVIAFRNELINQLNEEFDQFPFSPSNENLYVTLLWGIYDKINTEGQTTSTTHALLLKIKTAFMDAKFSLSPYNYKEIFNILLFIFNQTHSYKAIFFPVLEKHLNCMIECTNKKEDNAYRSMYLSNISKLLKLEFTANDLFKSNIIKLINSIDFTENTKIAVLGLQAISTILEKKAILLKDVESKIKKCLKHIEDKYLNFEETSITLRSIARYAISLKEKSSDAIPTNLNTKIDHYLHSLVTNIEKLSTIILHSTIIMFINLLAIEYPIFESLEKFIKVYNQKHDDFLKLSKNDLHSVMTNIAELSIKLKNKSCSDYTLKLIPFFNALMPRYISEIRHSPVNEQLNAIQAISQLIESGFLADAKMKRTYNHLVTAIDAKLHLLSESQLIEYLRNISVCFSLLSTNSLKILEYAKQLINLSFSIMKNDSVTINRKLTLLKTLLTFYEINCQIINLAYSEKFKIAINDMHDQICLEKTEDQHFHTLTLAKNWLGYNVDEHSGRIGRIATSDIQVECLKALKDKFADLHFEEEQSIDGLPPCDMMIPDKRIIIEVQGMFHFLDKNRTLKNGTSILKNALYKRKGYHVIEVQVIDRKIPDNEMRECVEKIKGILQQQSPSLPRVNF